MTADTTSKISENPKKKKQIQQTVSKRKATVSEETVGFKVLFRNYSLPPVGATKKRTKLRSSRLPL